MESPVRIIHTLGGCGGTLLSRCLGVLPGVALLSEVNPAAISLYPQFDPIFQDRNWIHLLTDSDVERLSKLDLSRPENFRQFLESMLKRADECGRHLILRDYNYLDFLGIPYTDSPVGRLTIYDSLPSVAHFAVAFIRHPIDQWLSLCKHDEFRNILKPAYFCNAYALFLEKLEDIRVFKYEDFVRQPEVEMKAICESLKLPFSPSFSERFHKFDAVTGDFTRIREEKITPAKPAQIAPEMLAEFRSSEGFRQVLAATGYEVMPSLKSAV